MLFSGLVVCYFITFKQSTKQLNRQATKQQNRILQLMKSTFVRLLLMLILKL